MNRIVVTVAATALLAGCGSRTTIAIPRSTGSNETTPAAATAKTPLAVTESVVERVLSRAPLPSGTRGATVKEAQGKGLQSRPMDQNLVDRHHVYVVPLAIDQAVTWFAAHPPPGMGSTGGSSTTGGPEGVTSEGLEFDGRATRLYNNLDEQIAVYPLDGTHAVVRIDALATWLPQPTAEERVPGDATAVIGFRIARGGATPERFRLTGSAVRELRRVLNNERPVNAFGAINCPNDDGTRDRLHFVGATPDPVFRVAASRCRFIAVTTDAARQPTLNGGFAVDQALQKILSGR
jgi:hypothetical protein